MNNTTSNETIYDNLGNSFVVGYENPYPQCKIYKNMLCGHLGLWVNSKWVCQTCWGYEKELGKGVR